MCSWFHALRQPALHLVPSTPVARRRTRTRRVIISVCPRGTGAILPSFSSSTLRCPLAATAQVLQVALPPGWFLRTAANFGTRPNGAAPGWSSVHGNIPAIGDYRSLGGTGAVVVTSTVRNGRFVVMAVLPLALLPQRYSVQCSHLASERSRFLWEAPWALALSAIQVCIAPEAARLLLLESVRLDTTALVDAVTRTARITPARKVSRSIRLGLWVGRAHLVTTAPCSRLVVR